MAVPLDSGDESGLLPAASKGAPRKERTLARVQRAREDQRSRELGADFGGEGSDSAQVPIRIDSDEEGPAIQLSSSVFELPPRQVTNHQETEENTILDLSAIQAKEPPKPELSQTSVDGAPAASAVPTTTPPKPNHRGQVGAIRKVLVECGLCGFHVQIPVEFFGKAIHCPSCAGNSIFTESTLDPIKDEILDRLAAETSERAAIYRGEPEGPSILRELLASSAIKSFLVGVGLGLFVLGAMWGALQYRRARAQSRIVEQAASEGWRYARNPGEETFHEPWCRSLDSHRPTERITAEEFERGRLELHACE